MGWTIDPSVGGRIRACTSAADAFGGATCVHGVAMERPAFRRFLRDTLLLEGQEDVDAEAVGARLAAVAGERFEAPPEIAAANRLGIPSGSLSLARHMGIDPVRLAMCAFDARGRAGDGARCVEATVRRALGRERTRGASDAILVKVTLSRGVTWTGRRLTARSTVVPAAVLQDLPGHSMRVVTDHSWSGWDSITVRSVERRGDSLIVDTDADAMEDAFGETV